MKLQRGQRITLNQADNGWNVAMPYGGGAGVALHGQSGTVVSVSATLAQVDIDKGPTVIVDRVNDPRVLLLDGNTVKLATKLAMLCADEIERTGKANAVAAARFLGACEVAYIMGYGNTPTHVDLDVREWVRNNPRPVDNSALREEIKAWFAKVESEVTVILAKLK